jgi:hypothetical protein
MKKIIYTLALLGLTAQIKAADLTVQENGPVGTYSSISSAITAAVDGDRIIIHPKIGQDAWVENLTINKSLELVSAQDSTLYKIQGDIEIEALTGREVTIIGANIVSGDIKGIGIGWKTIINISGVIINGGEINFNNQFYVNVVSNIIENGDVRISNGNIIGNELKNYYGIVISGSVIGDTIDIVANKVGDILCVSDIFLNVRNNFITTRLTTSGVNGIQYTFVSTSFKLNVINNIIKAPESFTSSSSSTNWFLKLESKAVILNNIFYEVQNSNSYGPYFDVETGSRVDYNFNYLVSSPLSIGNRINSSVNPINNANGRLILPTPAQNGADPSFEYYDLDLTRGDIGCYGGSYSLDNYFPITGSSRVFNVDMPFGLTTGGTLNIKAKGFDR